MHIDWLELLEHFLDHPFAEVTDESGMRITQGEPVPVDVVHVTTPVPNSSMAKETLASLTEQYRPTFCPGENGPSAFTWETIADANFPTAGLTTEEKKRVINACLEQTGDGERVRDGINYAFRPGVPVIIPYQEFRPTIVEFEDDALLKNTWWYPIMLDGKPTDIIEWQAMGPGKALACGLPRHSPQVVKETEVLGAGGLIARAKALRSELEKDGRRV